MLTHDQTTLKLIQLMEGGVWNSPWQLNSCLSAGRFGVDMLACDLVIRGA